MRPTRARATSTRARATSTPGRATWTPDAGRLDAAADDGGADAGTNDGGHSPDGASAAPCLADTLFCEGDEARQCNASGTASSRVAICDGTRVCRGGTCVEGCTAADSERSNVGCDFMVVDLDNEWNSSFPTPMPTIAAAEEQFPIVLANTTGRVAEAEVFRSTGTPGAPREESVGTFTVPANDLVQIDLATRNVDGSDLVDFSGATYLSNLSYRVRTNFPVVAYQFNPIVQSSSNDASLLLPVAALGERYRVMGWRSANPMDPGPVMAPSIPDRSFIVVVGTAADTSVDVTFGGDLVAGSIQGGGTIAAASAGSTRRFTLGPYDVLHLASAHADFGGDLSDVGDLSGTTIDASAPVAVFSGSERSVAPYDFTGLPRHPMWIEGDNCCTEHLEEQVFPAESWGSSYAIGRSPVRGQSWREPDLYRVVADAAGTVVSTNLGAPFARMTLAAGEVRDFWATDGFTLEASNPVSVQQVLVSQQYVHDARENQGGDPSLVLFPATQQFRDDYIFLCPPTFSFNYLVASVPQGAALELDGVLLGRASCEVESLGTLSGTEYESWTCPLTGGSHRVRSTANFGLTVYGYHATGSYGYAGGSDLSAINRL